MMKEWKKFYCWHDRKYGQYAAGIDLSGHWGLQVSMNGWYLDGWRERFVIGAEISLTHLSVYLAFVDFHFSWWV